MSAGRLAAAAGGLSTVIKVEKCSHVSVMQVILSNNSIDAGRE